MIVTHAQKINKEPVVVTEVRLVDNTTVAYYLTLDSDSDAVPLTANHSLIFDVNNGDRVIDLAGNLALTGDNTVASWIVSALTASKPVFSSATKALTSSGTMPVNQGGTNITSYAIGDLLYASGAAVLSKLADVAVGSVLISGGVGAAPSWSTDIATGVTIGTAYIYRVGGNDVAVADGGTNISSYAVGDLLYASTTGILSKLADVAVGQYLASGGVNTAPAWATLNQAAVAGLTTADTPTFAGITAPIYNHGAFTTQTPSSGFTVDWSTNHFQQVTITGADLDITFTNPAGPCKDLLLIVIQGDGDDTIDWANEADLYAPGGVGPSLSTGSGDIDLVQFIWTGTYYICVANYNILQVT